VGHAGRVCRLKQHDESGLSGARPWDHGGWQRKARRLGSEFGRLNFGEPTGTEFRKRFEAPFFEKFLKDRRASTSPIRPAFAPAESVGTVRRVAPMADFEPAQLYLEPGKELSFTAPASDDDSVAAS